RDDAPPRAILALRTRHALARVTLGSGSSHWVKTLEWKPTASPTLHRTSPPACTARDRPVHGAGGARGQGAARPQDAARADAVLQAGAVCERPRGPRPGRAGGPDRRRLLAQLVDQVFRAVFVLRPGAPGVDQHVVHARLLELHLQQQAQDRRVRRVLGGVALL